MLKLNCTTIYSLCAAVALTAGSALAQSGHFVTGGANAPTCIDVGTQLECSGKVAGLGGTLFEVTVSANGLAIIECENPGGNVAPGQDTEIDTIGTTGPLPTPRNGHYKFDVTTDEPIVPNTPTCPNSKWTAHVVDVVFSDATMTLSNDGVIVDVVVVNVSE